MADIFLSYARANLSQAQELAARLEASGYSLWFDESLPAHRPYADVIAEQLEAARSVFVIWSCEAVDSHWVRSEANRGRETGRLVQVRVDDCRLPMPFDQIQCVDLRTWDGDESSPVWQSVLAGISALAGKKATGRASQTPRPLKPKQLVSRRQLIVSAGGLAVIGAAGIAGWRASRPPEVSPQAQLLIQKGLETLQANDALETQDPGSSLQAIALLTDATQAAPDSALAWGGLAMAYAVRKRIVPLPEREGLASRCRAAAARSLELDPAEFRALGALRMIEPVYRNWKAVEAADRKALGVNPKAPILCFILADMLGSVGRWREAAHYSRRLDRKKFLLPGADRKLIVDLWSSGDLQAADMALDTAVRQWPQHPQVWRTRLAYLMYSGRPVEALAVLNDPSERPIELKDDFFAAVRATAEGLAGQRKPAQAIEHALGYLRDNPGSALQVAAACVALGDPQSAFPLLSGYYFAEGNWSHLAPIGGDEDRITNPLFQPPMKSVWRDPAFDRLLERIGLNAYWRETGKLPDFRRFGA